MTPKTQEIEVVGERHSGTNYLISLIGLNLNCNVLCGTAPKWIRKTPVFKEPLTDLYFKLLWNSRGTGWKHRLIDPASSIKIEQNDIRGTVFLVRDPLAWLVSMHRKPYHQKTNKSMELIDFAYSQWHPRPRDRVYSKSMTVLQLYQMKVRSYIEASNTLKNTIILRYEDVVLDSKVELKKIASRFSLGQGEEWFTNINKSTKGDQRSSTEFRSYIEGRKWVSHYKEEHVETILRSIDSELLGELEYPY